MRVQIKYEFDRFSFYTYYTKTMDFHRVRERYGIEWNHRRNVYQIPGYMLPFISQDKELVVELDKDTDLYLKKSILLQVLSAMAKLSAPAIQYDYKLQPFAHQLVGINTLISERFWGLFDEMGLGKTFQVLVAYDILKRKNERLKCLVVCPKIAFLSWEREIKKHTPHLSYQLLDTKCKIDRSINIYLINYDILDKREKELKNIVQNGQIIVDEHHRIKNVKAKRTKAFFNVEKKAQGAWYLSGTPISKRPESIYTFFKGVYPEATSYYEWLPKFCELGNPWSNWAVTGYKNMNILAKLIENKSLRRLKEDCLDLPAKHFVPVYCGMTSDQEQQYNEMKDRLYTTISSMSTEEVLEAPNVLAQLIRLLQIATHPALVGDDTKDSGKMDVLADLLEDIMTCEGRKVVVWTNYRLTADIVQQRASCYSTAILDGRVTSTKKRKEIVESFQDSDHPRIIIANPELANVSIDLHRADTAIYLDKNFKYVNWIQSQDRLQRIGSTAQKITIYSLIASDTVDEYVEEVLAEEHQRAQFVLGDNVPTRRILDRERLLRMLR